MVENSESISQEGIVGSDGDQGGERGDQATPLSVEEIDDLRQQHDRGLTMMTLLDSKGWTELLRPYLENSKAAAIKSWLKDNDPNARQAVLTIEGIQKWILNIVNQGKVAHDKLFPTKRAGDG